MPEKYAEAYLYSLFKKSNGNVAAMAKLDESPSIHTIHKYKREHGWAVRLEKENEAKKDFIDQKDIKIFGKKYRILEQYGDLIDEALLPEKGPDGEWLRGADGKVLYAGPEPKDFEKLLKQRLEIAREMDGEDAQQGPPQKQIINILQINVNALCDTFSTILKEFIVNGSINEGTARQLATRFTEEAGQLDVRLEPDTQ